MGDTRLSLGATYTRHDIVSSRQVVLPDFSNDLSADYAAGTTQVFGKLSQTFHLPGLSLTPYGSFNYVSHATDSFHETGGYAALTSAASVVGAAFTTIGLAADRQFAVGDRMLVTMKASFGWRHAFADDPGSINAFANGPDFSIFGAPIAGDAAVLGAGLNIDVGAGMALAVAYDGQIGSGAELHAVKGIWGTQF
jgi:outer membrane autotransporter protein